jgi:hypothetical protein
LTKLVDGKNPWAEDLTFGTSCDDRSPVMAKAGEKLATSQPIMANSKAEDAFFFLLNWDFTVLKLLKHTRFAWILYELDRNC